MFKKIETLECWLKEAKNQLFGIDWELTQADSDATNSAILKILASMQGANKDLHIFDKEESSDKSSVICVDNRKSPTAYMDFGTYDSGAENSPCFHPSNHTFVKQAYTTFFFDECSKCGYAPHYDANKYKFKKCHEDWLEWNKGKKSNED